MEVESAWFNLSQLYDIPRQKAAEVWSVLSTHYQEQGRYYHTLDHIDSLLKLSSQYHDVLVNKGVVDLSIFFHDIVYDPKSKTNEEDSAQLFQDLLLTYLDASIVQKVAQYIIETKKHDVLTSGDSDLQYFVDFDMSILGSERETYRDYCLAIRKEYSFYPDEAFRTGRSAFLRNTINEGKRIFATPEFHIRLEECAKANILWECEQLEAGKLI